VPDCLTAPVVDPATLARLRAAEDTMTPRQAQLAVAGLAQEILARCATDPVYWLRYVRTRDEADPEEAVKPFPAHLDYARRLVALLHTEPQVAIAKSRQMLASWCASIAMTHRARFRAHQHVIYQTQNWPDAVKMVAMPGGGGSFTGRCQFIEQNLPGWMQIPGVSYTEGRVLYPNGSMIEALPGGADKVRGKTPSLIVLDEMAFLEDAKPTYTAIAPLRQKGAHLIMISTPNGAEGNLFYHLWHGLPITQGQAA
jgi:hypothetical protein